MFPLMHRKRRLTHLAMIAAAVIGSVTAGRTAHAQALGSRLHVTSVIVGWNYSHASREPYAFVFVANEFGTPVDGAVVTGNWSGCNVVKGAAGTTQVFVNPDGSLRFDGAALIAGRRNQCLQDKGNCDFVFTVTSVSLPGMVYDQAANVTSSGSVKCNPLAP
jgi:hypothetical protein